MNQVIDNSTGQAETQKGADRACAPLKTADRGRHPHSLPSEAQQLQLDIATRLGLPQGSGQHQAGQVTVEQTLQGVEGPEDIARIRSRLNLPRRHPLGDLIALVETTIADNDDGVRRDYHRIFELGGLMQDHLKRKLVEEHDVIARDISHVIENQSPQRYRSIVEVVCNAIDFSPPGSPVHVELNEHGYTVLDNGAGMTPRDILEKLLVPTISGARSAGKASIGKFGMGFMTALNHLRHEGDSVTVDTAQNGAGYRVRFSRTEDGISVELGTQSSVQQGTRVSLHCSDFEEKRAEELLRKHVSKKRGSEVRLGNEVLNDIRESSILEVQTGTLESAAIIVTHSEKSKLEAALCPVQLLINGIMVEELTLEGLTLPESIAIDLPYTTSLPESRNAVVYDAVVAKALEGLGKELFAADLSVSHTIEILNALIPTAECLQNRAAGGAARNIVKPLVESAAEYLESRGLQPLPNRQEFLELDVEAAVFVCPQLAARKLFDVPGIEKLVYGVEKAAITPFLANFRPHPTTPVIEWEKYIFIDRNAWSRSDADKLLIDLYINEGRKTPAVEFTLKFHSSSRYLDGKASKKISMLERVMSKLVWEIRMNFNYFTLTRALFGEINRRDNHSDNLEPYVSYIFGASEWPIDTSPDNQIAAVVETKRAEIETARDCLSILGAPSLELLLASPIDERTERFAGHLRRIMSTHPKLFSQHERKLADLPDSDLLETFPKAHSENRHISEQDCGVWGGITDALSAYCEVIGRLDYVDCVERDEPRLGAIFRKYQNSEVFIDCLSRLDCLEAFYRLIKDNLALFERSYEDLIAPLDGLPFISRNQLQNIILAMIDTPIAALRALPLDTNSWSTLFATADKPIKRGREAVSRVHRDYDSFERLRRQDNNSALYLDFEGRDIHTLSYDEFAKKTETGRDIIDKHLPIIVGNMKSLLKLPQVESVLKQLRPSELPHDYFETDAYCAQANLFTIHELLRDAEQYAVPLSGGKLATIGATIAEHFDPKLMGKDECQQLLIYLKRVLKGGPLDDETFSAAQPLYLTWRPDEVYIGENDMAPERLFSPQAVRTIVEGLRGAPAGAFMDFAVFWMDVSPRSAGDQGKPPMSEWLKRAVDIWRDLALRSPAEYERLVALLRGNATDKWSAYKCFKGEGIHIHEVPPEVRPHVLHFRSGDTDLDSREVAERFVEISLDHHPQEITLVDVALARRLSLGKFRHRTRASSHGFAEWVQQTVNGKESLVVRRELVNAVFHQAATDPYLFLRELIQNSLDAVSKSGFTDTLRIDEVKIGDRAVIQISDPVGMSFETVMGYLFVPGASTKGEGDLGRFGIGFLSIFRDAEEVVIKTGRDGEVVTVSCNPMLNSAGEVVDIKLSYSVSNELGFRGTVIQKVMSRTTGQMHSAFLQDAVLKYGTYVDGRVMPIEFNGRQVNEAIREIASVAAASAVEIDLVENNPDKGAVPGPPEKFRVLSGAGACITVGGIYLREMAPELSDAIPASLRSTILGHGFVVDLPRSVELTRSRNDIASRDDVLERLKEVIPTLALSSFLSRFCAGEVDFSMIPYDYFWVDGTPAHRARWVDPTIEADAAIINDGGTLTDYSRYENRHKLLELLTVLKAVEYEGAKYSLRDIASNIWGFKGELAKGVDDLVRNARSQHQHVAEIQRKHSVKQIPDVQWTDEHEEYLREHHGHAYASFMEFIRKITISPEGRDIRHTLYCYPDGSLAHASPLGGVKGWNTSFFPSLSSGSEGTVLADVFAGRYSSCDTLRKILQVSTHEDAHLLQDSFDWGFHHNESFYELQRDILRRLLYNYDVEGILKDMRQRAPESTYTHWTAYKVLNFMRGVPAEGDGE